MPDTARLTPFAVALGPIGDDRLGEMHRALAAAEVDPFDRDAWALSQPGASLLHALRPEGGLGDAVSELVALAHAAFLYWQQGERLVSLSRTDLDALMAIPAAAVIVPAPQAYYLQLPPRRVWGSPVPDAPPEPLDGWFAVARGDDLALVAVFGLLPGRPGFTVAHAAGSRPGPLRRDDGSPLFAPTLEGGAAAGLWSIVGHLELLELAWRAHARVAAAERPVPVEGSAP